MKKYHYRLFLFRQIFLGAHYRQLLQAGFWGRGTFALTHYDSLESCKVPGSGFSWKMANVYLPSTSPVLQVS